LLKHSLTLIIFINASTLHGNDHMTAVTQIVAQVILAAQGRDSCSIELTMIVQLQLMDCVRCRPWIIPAALLTDHAVDDHILW